MKATAIAPANIAFIKYWGKKDENLRLPLNSSISMNLSNCLTTTTVIFSKDLLKDEIYLLKEDQPLAKMKHMPEFGNNKELERKELERIVKHLERIRKIAGLNLKAKVVSQNNFPAKAGIASSASGFAALTLAATKALGLGLSQKELSSLARLGSGSACRSIPDGFVEWRTGEKGKDSFAYSLYPPDWWDIRDIVVIISSKEKKIGSTAGMEKAGTSPFFKARLKNIKNQAAKIKKALKEKNFCLLGETIESEAINLHGVMMTQDPPVFYWQPETLKIMEQVWQWRKKSLLVYFTIDAGPNVHLICRAEDEGEVLEELKGIKEAKEVIVNKPARGARLAKPHLF